MKLGIKQNALSSNRLMNKNLNINSKASVSLKHNTLSDSISFQSKNKSNSPKALPLLLALLVGAGGGAAIAVKQQMSINSQQDTSVVVEVKQLDLEPAMPSSLNNNDVDENESVTVQVSSPKLVDKSESIKINNEASYQQKLESVFGKALFDIVQDHNQDIDTIKTAKEKGLIDNTPKTLIHFDYHSDMYRDNEHINKRYESIGNYINVLMSNGEVNEIYWIIPDNTKVNKEQKALFWDDQTTENWQFIDGPRDQKIYVDKENNNALRFNKPKDYTPVKYDEISFHKRLLSEIPSFKESSKQVIVDIDADFLSYNGYQAFIKGKESLNPGAEQLNQEKKRIIDTLYHQEIKPVLGIFCYSPEYTNENVKTLLNSFGQEMTEASKYGTPFMIEHRHSNTKAGEVGYTLKGRNIINPEINLSQ
jgi:hypothetical protein